MDYVNVNEAWHVPAGPDLGVAGEELLTGSLECKLLHVRSYERVFGNRNLIIKCTNECGLIYITNMRHVIRILILILYITRETHTHTHTHTHITICIYTLPVYPAFYERSVTIVQNANLTCKPEPAIASCVGRPLGAVSSCQA